MADIIVVLIVIVLLGFALRGAIRHFKGDSPCCGGGTGIIKTDDKELKNPVIGKKTVHIEGMKKTVEKAGFQVVSITE